MTPTLKPRQRRTPPPRTCSHVQCDVTGPEVHLYLDGAYCDPHSPWARKGNPRPGQTRYCLPGRCYCGECPPRPGGDPT